MAGELMNLLQNQELEGQIDMMVMTMGLILGKIGVIKMIVSYM